VTFDVCRSTILTGDPKYDKINKMAGISSTLYNSIFKRTSTFALACVGAALFFERTFDLGSELLFEKVNEGVCYVIALSPV
jgi:ubiquinol-cytochrome c reductase subunit 9